MTLEELIQRMSTLTDTNVAVGYVDTRAPESQPDEVSSIRAMIGQTIKDATQLKAGMAVHCLCGCKRTLHLTRRNASGEGWVYAESASSLLFDWITEQCGVTLLAYDPPGEKEAGAVEYAAPVAVTHYHGERERFTTGCRARRIDSSTPDRPNVTCQKCLDVMAKYPPAKCAPGCVPSAPCMGSACPAHREAGVMGLMSTHNLEYWSRKLSDACEARQWRRQQWEPLQSGHASLMGRYRVNRR